MIDVSIEPSSLLVGQPSVLTLRLTNASSDVCTNVVFKLGIPVQLVLLSGSERIELPKLAPGESRSYSLRVRPKQLGSCVITSPNFSYRTAYGQSSRILDLRLQLEVVAVPVAPVAVRAAPPLAEVTTTRQADRPVERSIATAQSTPVELFISYSHRDEDLRRELETHLSLLRRQGLISTWHDRAIAAGTEWADQIDEHLESAGVILMLVSADFLASDYCYEMEMTRAIERHEARQARVIPVILRPCDWHSAVFGKLQALPKDGKPITSWRDRDEALLDVAQGIRKTIAGLPPNP